MALIRTLPCRSCRPQAWPSWRLSVLRRSTFVKCRPHNCAPLATRWRSLPQSWHCANGLS